MLHVYRIKNNLTQSYGPFEFRPEDHETYFRRIHDLLILNSDLAIKNFFHVSTFDHIGTYDELTGAITYLKPEEIQVYNCQDDYEHLIALKNVLAKEDQKDA